MRIGAILTSVIVTGVAVYLAIMYWPASVPPQRARVLALLKDPGSAQFRAERVVRDRLCGEVNAKNSLGGYVGFERFIADVDGAVIAGGPLAGLRTGGERPTAELVADVDAEVALRQRIRRDPTAEEIARAHFEVAWARLCAQESPT